MKFKPKCEAVEESVPFVAVEVLTVHYNVTSTACLTVHLDSSSHGKFALVFNRPEAVRVLDEGQICEFWNTYATPNGWLWRVVEGGWLALESKRDGFWLTDVMAKELYEYMVVGDQCVFVLTRNPPTFEFDTDAVGT